jgi:hypothetical protein
MKPTNEYPRELEEPAVAAVEDLADVARRRVQEAEARRSAPVMVSIEYAEQRHREGVQRGTFLGVLLAVAMRVMWELVVR